ncbi:beta-lactamase/transpeptidase-like protein [Ampelomyces quisqualis]|uniref:Beta-lactamase/transpeptidase-like protein n=1 Tax=Ampelomyces quisqualis TaxID=50730 RepID=A0A6A5QE85_AMPQU|nr:beta-lactamase/transpeptidase-like protein [Ampelomyces quisqualis]
MPLSLQGVQGVKDVLDGFVKDGSPGLVFSAIDKSGKILVEHAAGTVGVDSAEPMDKDRTIFWLASCTKLVTAIAVLQLVEQGKIPLDDASFVKKLMPEIQNKKVYADGVTPADQAKDVTVRMMLAHTAGFAYAFFDPRIQSQAPVEGATGDRNDILNARLVNQPGSIWEYGINIDWAGLVLERVTGQTLGAYFQEHVFSPVGISASDASFFPAKEVQKNIAHMHQRDGEGKLSEREHLFNDCWKQESPEQQEEFFQSGGAGLWSNPKEYVKILAALLNDGTSPTTGRQILHKETVDLLCENQIPHQPDFARNGPPPANPTLATHAPEMFPQPGNPPQGWGFGGFLALDPSASGRGKNSMWWMGLANCFWWLDRTKGVAGMLGAQVLPNGDPKVIPAWYMCEKTLYDHLE